MQSCNGNPKATATRRYFAPASTLTEAELIAMFGYVSRASLLRETSRPVISGGTLHR
jgi:hypothetical protein